VRIDPGSPLGDAVARAAGRPVTEIVDAVRTPLEYDAFLAHREVNRIRARVLAGADEMPVALVEKITEGPDRAVPYLTDNAEREFAAYRSGLLDDLAPRVRAPRLLGSERRDDGRLTLWIEDVDHDGGRPLGVEAILRAARDLGALAARWTGRVPDEPWMFRGWIARHAQPEAMREGADVLARTDGTSVAVLGDRLPAGLRLLEGQERIRRILEEQPQTLCHHDAVGANVFTTAGATVLIDWESVGPGPVGADLASLLLSPRRGDASSAVIAEVWDSACSAYADGYREEGGELDAAQLAGAVDAAVCLRWKLVRDVADGLDRGVPARRGSLPGESPDAALADLVVLTDLVLASARRVLG
jgi:hypothetical protein